MRYVYNLTFETFTVRCSYKLIRRLISTSTCIFLSLRNPNEKWIPPPLGPTYLFNDSVYLAKDYVSNDYWRAYIYDRKVIDRITDISPFVPDTTIKCNGESYFSNKKYKHYPVIGLSKSQVDDFLIWNTIQLNRKKDSKNLYCSDMKTQKKYNAYFDTANVLKISMYLPEWNLISEVKSKYDRLPLKVLYGDTTISKTGDGKVNFDKNIGISFRFAIKYEHKND